MSKFIHKGIEINLLDNGMFHFYFNDENHKKPSLAAAKKVIDAGAKKAFEPFEAFGYDPGGFGKLVKGMVIGFEARTRYRRTDYLFKFQPEGGGHWYTLYEVVPASAEAVAVIERANALRQEAVALNEASRKKGAEAEELQAPLILSAQSAAQHRLQSLKGAA